MASTHRSGPNHVIATPIHLQEVRERNILGEASHTRGFVGRWRRAGSSAAVAVATVSKVGTPSVPSRAHTTLAASLFTAAAYTTRGDPEATDTALLVVRFVVRFPRR